MKVKTILSRWFILATATVIIGLVSGFGGMFLALFLHFIQHLVYNHSVFPLIQNHGFFYDVSLATPLNRVFVLILCGSIAGVGWWALFRYGKPLISIQDALKMRKPQMPIGSTFSACVFTNNYCGVRFAIRKRSCSSRARSDFCLLV